MPKYIKVYVPSDIKLFFKNLLNVSENVVKVITWTMENVKVKVFLM